MHEVHSLLVQLANEFENRKAWFGASYAHACVHLYQAFVEPDLGLEFQWYKGQIHSFGVEEALDWLRCERHLEWEPQPSSAGPAYLATDLGKEWLDKEFVIQRSDQVAGLAAMFLECEPGIRRILSPTQFCRARDEKFWIEQVMKRYPSRSEEDLEMALERLESMQQSCCHAMVPVG